MKVSTKCDRADKAFQRTTEAKPKELKKAKKLLSSIYKMIAEELVNDGRIQFQIGNEIYPKEESNGGYEDDLILGIMNFKKGERLTPLLDGNEISDTAYWEI